jgi:uncharacterized membrane protein YqjE
MRPRPRAGQAGLVHNLWRLVDSVVGFVIVRAELLGRESKAAARHLLIAVVALVAALLFVTLGYFFLLVSAVVAIAHLAGVSWIWVALAGALLHFILAIICVLVAKARLTPPPLAGFFSELARDREFLQKLEETSDPLP